MKAGISPPPLPPRQALIISIAVIVLSVLLMLGFSIVYSGYQQRQSDKRWCDLFETLDNPVPDTIRDPAQKARSIRAQQQFHKLRVDLGCLKK